MSATTPAVYSDLYLRAHCKNSFSACYIQSAKGSPLNEASEELPLQYQLTLSSGIKAFSSYQGNTSLFQSLTFLNPQKTALQACVLGSTLGSAIRLVPSVSPQYPSFPVPPCPGISLKTHPSDRQQGSGPTVHLIINSEVKRLRDGEQGDGSMGKSIAL